MQSVLYLLVNQQKSSFKIGITDDLKARHARLSSVWGTFDLASSRTVAGTRKDISGLEKTLHYLLEKWRIRPSVKAEGHTEWFSMDCFDKALEIINSVANLKFLKLDDSITNEISVNIKKENRRINPSYETFAKFDDLEQQWPSYEKGTLDFRDHPYREYTWLWTINISECLIHPMDVMRLQAQGAGINLVSEILYCVDEPSIVQISIPKYALSDMKKHVIFKRAYEFVSGKIKNLIATDFSRPESFDIESTPAFQEIP